MISNSIVALAAIIGATCGIWLLQKAWHSKQRNWRLVTAGWLLNFLSLVVWSHTTSIEKGIAQGIISLIVIALIFLSISASRSEPRSVRANRASDKKGNPTKDKPKDTAKKAATALLIGPISGLASLAFSTATFALLKAIGLEHSNNLTITYLLFPLLWALLAVTIGFQQNFWRRTLTLSSIGLISIVCIWVTT